MGAECCTGRNAPSNAADDKSIHQESKDQSDLSSLQSSLLPSPRHEHRSDEEGLEERIRLAVKSIVLDIPINAVEVQENWISPVTCKGAAIGAELVDKLKQNWKQVAFRTYVKRVAIEEGLIGKLLCNLRSSNQSLRRTSVYVLSCLVVPSQLELTHAFVQENGVPRLVSLLQGDDSEGLLATTVQILSVVYAAGAEGAAQVMDVTTNALGLLISRISGMRNAKYLQVALQAVTELFKQDRTAADELKRQGLQACLITLTQAITSGQVRAENTPQLMIVQQQLTSLQATVSKSAN